MIPTVVWDVDDVLNGLTREWWRWAREGTPRASLQYEDLHENPPGDIVGLSRHEYLASLDQFRRERYHDLEPVPAVVDWFRDEGDQYRHLALTAVPRALADVTATWVVRHFGTWITTFAFVPARAEGRSISAKSAESKLEYLAWLGKGDVLVEDRVETLAAARTIGVHGILIPQPWNGSAASDLEQALSNLSKHLSGLTKGRSK